MQQIELVTGVVKYPVGKVISTQYGDRVNVVILLTDGQTEVKLWGNTDDENLRSLKRNQAVQLAKDAKGYKLVSSGDTSPTSKGTPTSDPLATFRDEGTRETMKTYIKWQAKLFGQCLREAYQMASPDEEGEQLISSEDIRAIATTLYLQTVKKFNL